MPIFVRLSEGSYRFKVIAAAKNQRSFAELKNVYINPDRTETERELERQLRKKRDTLNKEDKEKPNEDRHYVWYIRADKLFKTDKKPNEGANGKPTEGANVNFTKGANGKPTEGANGKLIGGANSRLTEWASNF